MFSTLTSTQYASTTGITPDHIDALNRSITDTFIGGLLKTIDINAHNIVAYTMIALVIMIIFRVFYFYRGIS